MRRIGLILLLVCACALTRQPPVGMARTRGAGQRAPARHPATRRPNLVVILADDLGYGDLSAYGAKDLHTPHIDALARDGARFDNFYANSTVCSPSRAALLTGRYPDTVGVPGVIRDDPADSWGYLAPSARLLPQLLRGAGYHTALVGKWHLGFDAPNLPTLRGFDTFRGFLGDMMDDYYTHLRGGANYMRDGLRVVTPQGHATEVFTRWAVEYLNERRAADDLGGRRASPRQPFFLYLAYNAPHVPVQPPDEWLARVAAREPTATPQRQKLIALIEHLDDNVGRLVAALKANGQYDDTLIVFTSDNGGQLSAGANNGALRGGKEEMYEGGLRVPMCAVWPGHIAAGSRFDRVALLMDLFPTFCEAAGVAPERPLDGVSLLPSLAGLSSEMPERTLFWMRREGGAFYQGRDYYAVRRGAWKLMQNHPFMPYRLYNLADDPAERNDVAARHADVVKELSEALRAHLQLSGAVPWQKPR